MAEDYLLEQYKLAFDTFNREMQRFWFRFNVLLGFEIAGLIGIVAKIDVLTLNKPLFRGALIFMCIYSALTLMTIGRGIRVYRKLIEVIEFFEDIRSHGRLHIVRLFKCKSKIRIFKREWKVLSKVSSAPVSMHIARIIAAMFVVAWVLLWIYAECVDYKFQLPKSTESLKIDVGDVRGSY